MTVEVARSNIWCVAQEPPDPSFRWIEKGFPWYGRVFTQDDQLGGRKISHGHGSLPWHVGRSYDELRRSHVPEKVRDLSWITSTLSANAGHRRRLAFLKRLQDASVPFDLFGRGFRPLTDKWEGLAPYRYSIAVENHSAPHYWTEKIADCFLAGAMPLYFGARNIGEYFPAQSFVWIEIDDPDAPRRIAAIIRSDLAERNREAIAEARRRVLEEHQFFPRFARLIAEDQKAQVASPSERISLPSMPDLTQYYRDHTPLQRLLHRVTRRGRGLFSRPKS
ncbi:MAG: glycosyltransferase family 10 [Opitutaceae bacterium]